MLDVSTVLVQHVNLGLAWVLRLMFSSFGFLPGVI